jgi:hypothetical protein
MDKFTIAPGETLTPMAFNFNGPKPGPALQPSETLTGTPVVTTEGGLTASGAQIASAQVVYSLTCPASVPVGTRAAVIVRANTSAGQVLVDRIEVLVAY